MAALTAYRGLTSAGLPLINLLLRRRMARGKEDRERFGERTGVTAKRRPDGTLIWMHAASVGEAQSVLALIDRLLAQLPGLFVLVTTGTVTSAAMMAERLPARAIHQYIPVDRAPWVRRFLDHWRPDAVLWVESELWPNLVTEIGRRDIPLALVNGRMSVRSHRGWARVPRMAARLMSAFDVVLAQDETVGQRFSDLGAQHVQVTGSLKYAADPLPDDREAASILVDQIDGRPFWLAASTHEGEEEEIVAAHRMAAQIEPSLLTIIVPRHPPRAAALVRDLRRGGIRVAQRSKAEAIDPKTQIYLADTMGELGLFYRLTDIAFVGGSLVPKGCQNLLEPAQLDCAVLHGPDTTNFQIIAADLHRAEACVEVSDHRELARQVILLMADDDRRQGLIRAARQVAMDNVSVIDTVLLALEPVLDGLRASSDARA